MGGGKRKLSNHRYNRFSAAPDGRSSLFLDLPQEGKLVRQGEVVFSFESMTMIHDFIAPVTGTIIEVNQSLYDDPGILNDAPFDQGWLVVIEMENEKDLAILMRSKGYKHQIGIKMSFPRLDVYESPTKEVLDV